MSNSAILNRIITKNKIQNTLQLLNVKEICIILYHNSDQKKFGHCRFTHHLRHKVDKSHEPIVSLAPSTFLDEVYIIYCI